MRKAALQYKVQRDGLTCPDLGCGIDELGIIAALADTDFHGLWVVLEEVGAFVCEPAAEDGEVFVRVALDLVDGRK
jgi:hypothetical protein